MLNASNILILAPHPDDGELGAGGLIAKMSKQHQNIHYVAFSRCLASLPSAAHPNTLVEEMYASTSVLGISKKNVSILDFPVRNLSQSRQEILEVMVSLKKKIQPTLVLIPSLDDIHQDHSTISNEAVRAFKHSNLLGYEMPWNNLASNANFFVELNPNDLEAKVTAYSNYNSQQHRAITSDYLRSLAITRGLQANVTYAEAYTTIRLYS